MLSNAQVTAKAYINVGMGVLRPHLGPETFKSQFWRPNLLEVVFCALLQARVFLYIGGGLSRDEV